MYVRDKGVKNRIAAILGIVIAGMAFTGEVSAQTKTTLPMGGVVFRELAYSSIGAFSTNDSSSVIFSLGAKPGKYSTNVPQIDSNRMEIRVDVQGGPSDALKLCAKIADEHGTRQTLSRPSTKPPLTFSVAGPARVNINRAFNPPLAEIQIVRQAPPGDLPLSCGASY